MAKKLGEYCNNPGNKEKGLRLEVEFDETEWTDLT